MAENQTAVRLMTILEERGVDHRLEHDLYVEWVDSRGNEVTAFETSCKHRGDVLIVHAFLTPEQAIVATLGSERNTSLDNVDAGRDAQFAEAMRRIVEKNTEFGVTDIESSHRTANELMCDLLLSHGYVETVDAFKNMRKWYG